MDVLKEITNQPKTIYKARVYDDTNMNSYEWYSHFYKEADAYQWLRSEYFRLSLNTTLSLARRLYNYIGKEKVNMIMVDGTLSIEKKKEKIFDEILVNLLKTGGTVEGYFMIYFQIIPISVN